MSEFHSKTLEIYILSFSLKIVDLKLLFWYFKSNVKKLPTRGFYMRNVYHIDKAPPEVNKISKNTKYIIISLYALSLIIFGLFLDSPQNILIGLKQIIIEPDLLITDYIGVGGLGAAFVNSGLITLLFILFLYRLKLELYGTAIAALFIIAGFSFFGKNLFNVWFIIIGVYLYSRFQRETFSRYIYIALFGTALAPLTTELLFTIAQPLYVRIPLATLTGLAMGFILPPLSTFLLRVHEGFSLYNVGFTAGLIGTVFMSIFKSLGMLPEQRMVWTTGNNYMLFIFLFSMFISMIIIGYLLNNKSFRGVKDITEYPGRMVTDFVQIQGFSPTLINMGICGIIAIVYIVLVNGDINGPTIAGIFTIVGFSAFGKHPKNILPIFLGVYLGSLASIWKINDPRILLAALFGTTLAPISGEFGWKYGALAGFLHSSIVLNIGVLHGGINLYNNGFAGGLVAAFLVPIIEVFRKDDN
jgi:hypothetical protein